MKVELGISHMSNVMTMSKCPEYAESICGIMYRVP